MIDLRSDTLTQPTESMRSAMAKAPVGDDVYGEDPTVNVLESYAADLLGKQAGLFVPSGTQSNLLALLTHCGRGDEYIVGQEAHTYKFEGGGAAALGGIQPQPLELQANATFDLGQLAAAIKPVNFHFARTRLVCLENTHSGISVSLDYINTVSTICRQHDLRLHLDGARFFNATLDQGLAPDLLAAPFHSVSICLSKGLGAPVGSVLLGPSDFIGEARRWRKMVGGGMRQAGIIAAGGLHALQYQRERLVDDHLHAERVAQTLAKRFSPNTVRQNTNMVNLELETETYARLQQHLRERDIQVDRPRWVLHLDISGADVDTLCAAIECFRFD